jgi:phage N-6-adenine-methyltransferase
MGIGKSNKFKSIDDDYSSPISIAFPLVKEFGLTLDVCASKSNAKCERYFTVDDDSLEKDWIGNCWMNPPFGKDLGKWVRKAYSETKKHGGVKVCLIPVISNTKWWGDVCQNAEIRFIIGEVIFDGQIRGLWLPMCIMIFGDKAKHMTFSSIDFIKPKRHRQEVMEFS